MLCWSPANTHRLNNITPTSPRRPDVAEMSEAMLLRRCVFTWRPLMKLNYATYFKNSSFKRYQTLFIYCIFVIRLSKYSFLQTTFLSNQVKNPRLCFFVLVCSCLQQAYTLKQCRFSIELTLNRCCVPAGFVQGSELKIDLPPFFPFRADTFFRRDSVWWTSTSQKVYLLYKIAEINFSQSP